jgi:beta-glucanase (GH16 family)
MRFNARSSAAAAVLAAALPVALAQTSTSCNPTEKTCPSDTGLNLYTYSVDFTSISSLPDTWTAASATNLTFGSNGAEFIITESGQAPTISTDFYFLFGRVDVKMKAAPGVGIVSSVVLESDDLDEIDWEWLGGDTTQVETNFFGKGNTTSYDRATYETVSTPQDSFHTYTVDWTSDRIEWIVDGATVRTLASTDALALNGKNYPQTPMQLKLGNWCGGCSGESAGTIEWAGGNTTFNDAPYIMYVEKVDITNYNPADKYTYGDETGDWESIKITNGSSSASAVGSTTVASTATSAATGSSGSGSSSKTTSAPTSKISVAAIGNTAAAVPTTITGSSYSMNTASASAQNSNSTGAAGTGSHNSATATVSGPSSSSSSSAATNGAASNAVFTAGSLLSVALAFFML